MAAVEVERLTRIYKGRHGGSDVRALDGVDLTIEDGAVHGLLGPNGAGKTTLVKVLSTVLLPTSGTARILGHDVVRETDRVRRLIGIVFGGDRGLYFGLTGRQNLLYWAALYGVPESKARRRAAELLARVGLEERANARVETYSRGMKQRLHLARGLVADARVLFLDEPTTGMDPIAARDFRALVVELRGEGRTILLTTHDMAEAESVCDRVALIDHGRLLAVESPRTLATWLSRYERIDVEGAPEPVLDRIRSLPGVGGVSPSSDGGTRIDITADGTTSRVLKLLVDAGVTSIRTSMPSLEEVYVRLIGDRGLKI
jgi:ABC-2 type transport system ATP-binding protein